MERKHLVANLLRAQLKTVRFATLKSTLESEDDPRIRRQREVCANYPYVEEHVRHFLKRFTAIEAVSAKWVKI